MPVRPCWPITKATKQNCGTWYAFYLFFFGAYLTRTEIIRENMIFLYFQVKVTDYPVEQKEDVRHSKMMAEVYLTRLLKTKVILIFIEEKN